MVKIRSGFVTNSSSSSFVIIGKSADINNLDFEHKKYKAIGIYLCEGLDVFDLNADMVEFMQLIDGDFAIIEVYKYLSEPYNDTVVLDSNKFQIWSGEEDMDSSTCLNDLKENYRVNSVYLRQLLKQGKITIEKFLELTDEN